MPELWPFENLGILNLSARYEPPRDKTNNVAVRPAKTQISLGIRPAKDPRFLHADNEDSDRTGRMPRLI